MSPAVFGLLIAATVLTLGGLAIWATEGIFNHYHPAKR